MYIYIVCCMYFLYLIYIELILSIVAMVYTFGAPRVQRVHATNKVRDQLKKDGCFDGYRVFLSRGDRFDPIPTLQQSIRIHQPRRPVR